jgi:hypothetical protein
MTLLYTGPFRIRIRKLPPTMSLEGHDLSQFRFREGQMYQVPESLAVILAQWGYAEIIAQQRDRAADREPD